MFSSGYAFIMADVVSVFNIFAASTDELFLALVLKGNKWEPKQEHNIIARRDTECKFGLLLLLHLLSFLFC